MSKTKLMIISRRPRNNAILYIEEQMIERASKYLGSTLNDK